MAIDGILQCFQRNNRWFSGVVLTDGSGAPRDGIYSQFTDEEMKSIRILEQKKAAIIGEYAAQIQLSYSSNSVKDPNNIDVVLDLTQIIQTCHPEVIYTHNLADKHPTHVATVVKVIQALRSLPSEQQPKKIYGCEVWRDLDWMRDEDKIVFDCSARENLQNALLGVYDSQISGGKRYDLASMGRRFANATYHTSHTTDSAARLTFGMDLTPLIANPKISVQDYVRQHIERFAFDVDTTINNVL